jgi:hypothetical protein
MASGVQGTGGIADSGRIELSSDGIGDYGMSVDQAWQADSGEQAVQMAKGLRTLKERARVEPAEGGIRVVEGRTFILRDGYWVEKEFEESDEPTTTDMVEVKFLSKAYFDLLRADRSLAPFLSLGKNVILRCPGGFVKVSEESGVETLSEGTLEGLLKV